MATALLRAAIDHGELRRDLDVDAALDTLLGVFYYQAVVRGCSLSDPESLRRCREAFEVTCRGMEA